MKDHKFDGAVTIRKELKQLADLGEDHPQPDYSKVYKSSKGETGEMGKSGVRQFSLVKYDWNSLPKEWTEIKTNPYEGRTFIVLGEIPNMPGHCFCQDIDTGKGYIFHPESIIELTEEEV